MQYHMLGYHRVATRVRFGQTDRYGHTWHGHLATFFEEGRADFARRYKLGTDVLLTHNISIPMIELTGEYCHPSYEDELLDIQLTLLRPVLKLPGFVFIYRIFGGTDKRVEVARGRSRQIILNRNGIPVVRAPIEVNDLLETAWSDLRDAPHWSDPRTITNSRILMGDQVTAVESPDFATTNHTAEPSHHEDRA